MSLKGAYIYEHPEGRLHICTVKRWPGQHPLYLTKKVHMYTLFK